MFSNKNHVLISRQIGNYNGPDHTRARTECDIKFHWI